MLQPEWFNIEGQEDKMCQLIKVIYGYFTFHNVICEFIFVSNAFDPYMYTQVSGGTFVILSLYVDNILSMMNNLDLVIRIKEWFKSRFEMKDMGETSFILGIKIERD